VRVTQSAPQSIATTVLTAVNFNVEAYDTDSYHDNAVNPSRIVMPSTGFYHVSGVFNTDANQGTYGGIRLNGTTYIWKAGAGNINTNVANGFTISLDYNFTAGDYIELIGTFSTATNNTKSGIDGTQLEVHKIANTAGASGTVSSVTSANADATVANTTSTPVITIVSAPRWTTGRTLAITGDLAYTSPTIDGTGNVTAAGTLATVNTNVGAFGSATQVGTFTVNGKGLITAAANVTVTPAVGSITGLGTGVATALAVNVGTAGSPVVNGGALGTPTSGNLTATTLKKVTTTASSATPTPTGDAGFNIFSVTALATNATIGAPTGTPVEGNSLVIRITPDATPRTLAYNAIYRAIGVTLPTTTVASKTIYLGAIYNSTSNTWDINAYALQA
jgi:hypothetical protein